MALLTLAQRLRDGFRAGTKLYLMCRPVQRRDVVLCCNAGLAGDYLSAFLELFRDDPRLKFRVLFLPASAASFSANEIQRIRDKLRVPEVSRRWACARLWDLVVCADHCLFRELRQSKAILIGHGARNKSMDGGSTTYTYEKSMAIYDTAGRCIYKRIFEDRESNRDQAVRANPVLKDVVVVVGSMDNDRLLAQKTSRDDFRRQLGYQPEDVVVFVVGTWGPLSLFQTMGDEILAEARRLQPAFKFILSAHPHEYRSWPGCGRVWGEYLRSQTAHGFKVREPTESWIPYMVASDIVVSDYSGLLESAALLEKPIIVTPVPDRYIWRHSITWKIRQFAPLLSDAKMLQACLLQARSEYPFDKLHEAAQSMHSHSGEAAARIRKEVYDLLMIPPHDPAQT